MIVVLSFTTFLISTLIPPSHTCPMTPVTLKFFVASKKNRNSLLSLYSMQIHQTVLTLGAQTDILTCVFVSQDRQEDVLQSDKLQAGRGSSHLQRAAEHQEGHQHRREGEAGPHPGICCLHFTAEIHVVGIFSADL